MQNDLMTRAKEILHRNDLGGYTVPTHGLYPFQWNWDSCLTALGFAHFNEPRAWLEIETLFANQWDDGMVPHIIFHAEDAGYFPGPAVWRTDTKTKSVPTSGITQPPVAGFVIKLLYERATDKTLARAKIAELLPKIHAWHDWFYRARDPQNTGLVAILHPWESGRDNAIDWDAPLARVNTDAVAPFTRRDTQHANPAHRPTQAEYNAYIALVQGFADTGWDNTILHDASPFQMVDTSINAILLRSCTDLAWLADEFNMPDIATQSREWARQGGRAMESLWNDKIGQYTCFDRVSGTLNDCPTIGGLLGVIAPIDAGRARALIQRIADLGARAKFLVPSHDPNAPDYDGARYWRGPAWLIMNYMIADGLRRLGESDLAGRIARDSLSLINAGGFAEYYDPQSGAGCGGSDFTWTAAMVIEFIKQGESPPESPTK